MAPGPPPGDEHAPAGDEPVTIPIDALDLHAFAPREVRSVVESYLEAAAGRGLREVRLIHGRGTGAQRASVQALLARHPLVERYRDAPPERGGWGATIVALRAAPPPPDPARRCPSAPPGA